MVKQKIVIDTDVIIDHLRGGRKSKLEIVLGNRNFIPLISVATIQELFAGQSSKIIKEEKKIRKILALFKIISLNQKIGELAGKIMRDTIRIVQFADAQIAAMAILEKALFLTKNEKDFAKIKGVKFYE